MNLNIRTGTVFDRFALACGAISVGIGGLGLTGWALGSRVLTGVRLDYIPMAPNTALLVILLGCALFSGIAWHGNRTVRIAITGIAWLCLLISGLTLLQFVTGINLMIDSLLLTATGTVGAVPIGLMSPVTAISFLSGSAAVLLQIAKKNHISALLSLVMALIGGVVILGYGFGAPLLYGGTIIPVALPTAAALGILGIGLIAAAGPDSWPLSSVTGTSTRARLLRGLLPVILIIVLLVNWMNTVIRGNADSSIVLSSAVTVIFSLLVVYLVVTYVSREIGDAIDRSEQERRQAEESLKFSNILLSTQQEVSIDGILVVDESGKIISYNRKFAEMWGISSEVITSQSDERALQSVIGKLVNPDEFLNRIRYLYEHKDEKSQEEIALADGRIFDRYSAPMIGSTGNYYGRIWYFRDITDRKRDAEAIRVREEQFRVIFHNQQNGLMMIDASTHQITDINASALKLIGASYDDVVGKTCHTFICPAEKGKCPVTDLGHTVESSERVLIKANGEEIPILKSVSLIKIGGRPFLIESFVDLSERKQMEESLRWEKDLWRGTFDSIPDLIAIINIEHRVLQVNKAMADKLAVSPNAAQGIFCYQAVHGTENPPEYCPHHLVLKDGKTHTTDTFLPLLNGYYTITTSPLFNPDGSLFGSVHLAHDITEKKNAEELLKRFNEELEEKVRVRTEQLQKTNIDLEKEVGGHARAEEQIQASLDEKVVLLREVHHRVKNNLQIIISLLNLQSRYLGDEKSRQALRESQNRVRAMSHVHEKLYQSPDITKIDLDSYFRFLGDTLFQFYGITGKGIVLTTRIQEINVDISTAIPVGLIINELISNSLKHAFPDGRKGEISIAIQRQDAMLAIRYSDNGIGIPQDFDWRNAESLGLRLVILLVEQLDGTIELDRTAGTAFTIVVKEKE